MFVEPKPITFVSSTIVQCIVCQEQVSAYRYAQHLEKCINGTKRNSTNRRKQQQQQQQSSSSISEGISTSTTSVAQPRKRQRVSYGSLTVRIRLKNGVPISKQKRSTVPSLIFLNRSLSSSLPVIENINENENEIEIENENGHEEVNEVEEVDENEIE